MTGTVFRWKFADDVAGEQWSDWHVVDGPCESCCHGGPHEGEHLQFAGYYEDGLMNWNLHSRLNPRDIEEWMTVEWKT